MCTDKECLLQIQKIYILQSLIVMSGMKNVRNYINIIYMFIITQSGYLFRIHLTLTELFIFFPAHKLYNVHHS